MVQVQHFFDPATSTLTYVVWDPSSKDAVIIDPVLDYDAASSRTSTASNKKLIAWIKERELTPHFILETHCHADHLSGSQDLKLEFPQAQIAIGRAITAVQKIFKPIFGLPVDFATDGSQFDRLLDEGETVRAGTLSFEVLFTPGHTPACAAYRFGDQAIFVGDALFMPDSGTGRCDFPGGDAHQLFNTVSRKLYGLPPELVLYTGHDYQPGGRELRFSATVAEQRNANIHIKAGTTEEEFVRFRLGRDATLPAPKLLLPAVQINLDAGHLPHADSQGRRFLKIPIQ